jgi:two-component system cell cycle response regulator
MVAPNPQRHAAPKILLVDDHEQNLELLEAYLEDIHAHVSTAIDGLDALAKVKADKPDLILLDIMMPKMSGYQVAKKLKADAATKDIPIIMVTALGEVSDIEKAHDAGVQEFITKPVNKQDLLSRVKAMLPS